MQTTNLRNIIFNTMKILNLCIVIFLSSIMRITIRKISESTHARDYLQTVNSLPPLTWGAAIFSVMVLVMLISYHNQLLQYFSHWVLVCAEILSGLAVIVSLDMNYNGVILLIAVHVLRYFKQQKEKIFFFVLISMSLLIFDFEIYENFLDITPFSVYAEYYTGGIKSLLIFIKNFGVSVNMALFIIYTILLLNEQVHENEEINLLNAKLNKTNEDLQKAYVELEEYAKESEKMAETKERNRLAREIHDTLGHTLTGIIAGIDAAITILPISKEQTHEQLQAVSNVARQGMTDVRRSVNALRPDMLENNNLMNAIHKMIHNMKMTGGADIHLDNRIEKMKFSEDEEEIIYRIIQEGITNAIRHGKATIIEIYIQKVYSVVQIQIKDNGKGAENVKPGFGLQHMEERLSMLGGQLSYESKNGFLLTANIPIRWGEEND